MSFTLPGARCSVRVQVRVRLKPDTAYESTPTYVVSAFRRTSNSEPMNIEPNVNTNREEGR